MKMMKTLPLTLGAFLSFNAAAAPVIAPQDWGPGRTTELGQANERENRPTKVERRQRDPQARSTAAARTCPPRSDCRPSAGQSSDRSRAIQKLRALLSAFRR